MSSPAGVSGVAAAGYGRVADVFADNLRYGGEVGTVCAVYVDGDLVVDLWAARLTLTRRLRGVIRRS